jgi:hypothetical protein
MGKGSNVQKKQQAQLRNQKDKGKTDEERKAAAIKTKQDAAAFICELCKQTFMVNARKSLDFEFHVALENISLLLPSVLLAGAPLLYQHVVAKHPVGTSPSACFPVQLKDFDPSDPKGEKKLKEEPVAAIIKPKKVVKKDPGLDDLLNAGLTKSNKK